MIAPDWKAEAQSIGACNSPALIRTQPWVLARARLWSLLDMYEFAANQFVGALRMLEMLHWTLFCITAKHPERRKELIGTCTTGIEEMQAQIDKLVEYCQQLGLKVATQEAALLASRLQTETIEKLEGMARHLGATINRELNKYQFRYLTPEEEARFVLLETKRGTYLNESPRNFFGPDVHDKLPSSRYDMQEALLCYAYGRDTACVQHLTKIMESALRAFGASVLGKKALINRNFTPKNWGQLAADIQKAVDSHNPRSAKAKALKDARKAILDRFENVRNVRHNAHHPDEEYSPDETDDFLKHIPAFLRAAVEVI